MKFVGADTIVDEADELLIKMSTGKKMIVAYKRIVHMFYTLQI